MNSNDLRRATSLLVFIPFVLSAQVARQHDSVPIHYWAAPLYWQPAPAAAEERAAVTPADTGSLPASANPLVFVAITPCRVVDTRASQSFTGAFGPPSLVGGTSRTFPIQSSTTCTIPSVAQAYSFNITVVPPGPLGYVTAYPTGQSVPLASTVNSPQGFIVGNAAIVPAGTSGSINVFASNATDMVIDINGYYAAISTSAGNTTLGVGTLANNTSGTDNTASGTNALLNNTTGNNNTANGFTALMDNTVGALNTATGFAALLDNTTGSQNTANGATALAANTGGSSNTATGFAALLVNTIGSLNTANGVSALQSNTTGNNNTATGFSALLNNTTGSQNTATGVDALTSNTTGTLNTAVGAGVLQVNTANQNTGVGASALQNNTSGANNTASGFQALSASTTGASNTASGASALLSNTSGSDNTASGQGALSANTTGSFNIATGYQALQSNTTGSSNIAIGVSAASSVTGSNGNNIHIGSLGSAADSGAIRIGTPATQLSFFAAGIRGVTTGNNDAVAVVIDSAGQLGTVSSSRRFKEDIHDMDAASSDLMRLRPVIFRYRKPFADGSKPIQYGLIAEEVAEVYPDLIARSADGQIETVKYQVLDSMLLNELQKQHLQVEQQAETIRLLQTRLAALEEALSIGK